jgi:hypothetical protein
LRLRLRILQALWLALALLAVALAYSQSRRAVDFMAYYYPARVAMGLQAGQVYGLASGIGWPQFFRYPPLFLVFVLPLGLLPYKISVAVWAAFKCIALYLVARALGRRLNFRSGFWWLVPVAVCGGFWVQELVLGNAQFLIFAVCAAGFLWLEREEWRGAFLFGLGVTLKIWPLFFLPYLAVRKGVRTAALMLVSITALMLLPAAYFGWSGNVRLIHNWVAQEWSLRGLAAETWFPGQSLAGILQRYLTYMDYSKWPDRNYLQLHLLNLHPRMVEMIWYALAGAAYLGLLWLARESHKIANAESPLLLADALAFCALPLLSPFAHRIAFVVLLWPAMVAGALLARRGFPSSASKKLIYAAVIIEAAEPLFSSAKAQRLFQVIGVDFWAACILTAALLMAWVDSRRMPGAEQTAEHVPWTGQYEFAARK